MVPVRIRMRRTAKSAGMVANNIWMNFDPSVINPIASVMPKITKIQMRVWIVPGYVTVVVMRAEFALLKVPWWIVKAGTISPVRIGSMMANA